MPIYLDLVEALAYMALFRRARVATEHLDAELSTALGDAELHIIVKIGTSIDYPDSRLN